MKCIKCNVQLPKDSKYCLRCGKLLDDTYFNVKKTKEDILFEYIINGEVYNTKISIKYLCFNFIYAFYKRMYKEGIISFCTMIIFLYIIVNFIKLLVVFFGIGFIPMGFCIWIFMWVNIKFIFDFDNMYLKSVHKFVKKTIKNNEGASLKKLEFICDKRRKNDWISAIVSIFLFIVLILIINM